MVKKVTGQEIIMDLKGVDPKLFHKKYFDKYFKEICKVVDMELHGKAKYWFDIHQAKYLRGISAMQFIKTSTITMHAFKYSKSLFINVFTCKLFDQKKAAKFTREFFKPKSIKTRNIMRYSWDAN